ncbi:MAG TPA: hypothetical protein VN520_25445 [Streptomyces sp.]|uniref:hypothetical protein n=1 Tax=Streptomyces sp. TaxID=1931 RepID=UPI002D01CD3D|nr:hypothetical protein [Streptomyces sp.]HWU09683.1 hypothetical protein [Streptomyces sp.]
MSTWFLSPEQRPAPQPPHPLDALATTLHNDLAPQGWEVWSFLDDIEVTCPCGQRVAVTTDNSAGTRRWTLTPESEPAGTVVLTDLNGLSSVDHVSRILGFLCSRHTDDAATAMQG